MVGACAGILDCRQSQLNYRYTFTGADVHVAYSSEHQSETKSLDHKSAEVVQKHETAQINLPLTGGHVQTAPGTNEKLAATAVSPTESVV